LDDFVVATISIFQSHGLRVFVEGIVVMPQHNARHGLNMRNAGLKWDRLTALSNRRTCHTECKKTDEQESEPIKYVHLLTLGTIYPPWLRSSLKDVTAQRSRRRDTR
jgi:hypothetical protein